MSGAEDEASKASPSPAFGKSGIGHRCRLSDCMDMSRFRRANGSLTCSGAPKPIEPGRRLPAGTHTGPPLLAGATPTARAPRAGQPLHERTLPAPRTPALHLGAHGGRGRRRHTLGKSEATAPDDERRSVMNSYPVPVRGPPTTTGGSPTSPSSTSSHRQSQRRRSRAAVPEGSCAMRRTKCSSRPGTLICAFGARAQRTRPKSECQARQRRGDPPASPSAGALVNDQPCRSSHPADDAIGGTKRT